MKRFVYSILQILVVCLLAGCVGVNRGDGIPVAGEENYVPFNYETVRALWISQYDMYDV